jgi:hypothetical protein
LDFSLRALAARKPLHVRSFRRCKAAVIAAIGSWRSKVFGGNLRVAGQSLLSTPTRNQAVGAAHRWAVPRHSDLAYLGAWLRECTDYAGIKWYPTHVGSLSHGPSLRYDKTGRFGLMSLKNSG